MLPQEWVYQASSTAWTVAMLQLWLQGNHGTVIEYVAQDVRATLSNSLNRVPK